MSAACERFRTDALAQAFSHDADPILRYLHTIIVERGDFNGRVLSVRRDDVRALCVICQCTEAELFQMVEAWDALLSGRPEVRTAR